MASTATDVDMETCDAFRRQATINIGGIGMVAHGKTTLVKALTGVHTVRHKAEIASGRTLKLGYANAKIFKCQNEACPRPANYKSFGSATPDEVPCARDGCGGTMTLQRHVSFVDCPGHDSLMATMLNGASVMDGAVLLVSAAESCPQPQTAEHLAAVEIMCLRDVVVLQNKIDLVQPQQTALHYEQIQAFVRGTVADNAPIIPISAQLQINMDLVCEYLCTRIPQPVRDLVAPPRMTIIRSFDVNKPGEGCKTLQGGVAGGALVRGVLRVGQLVEIRPGIVRKTTSSTGASTVTCQPIQTRIVSLLAEKNALQVAIPGGLIGVGLQLDPTLARADRLVGHVLGAVGSLPDNLISLDVDVQLMRHVIGVAKNETNKSTRVTELVEGEMLMANVGSTSTGARVSRLLKKSTAADDASGVLVRFELTTPVCAEIGDKLTISRRIDKRWRLIGWATIRGGREV